MVHFSTILRLIISLSCDEVSNILSLGQIAKSLRNVELLIAFPTRVKDPRTGGGRGAIGRGLLTGGSYFPWGLFSRGAIDGGLFSMGAIFQRGYWPGGYWPGGYFPWGLFSRGGLFSQWGYWPGGYWPGGLFSMGAIFQGGLLTVGHWHGGYISVWRLPRGRMTGCHLIHPYFTLNLFQLPLCFTFQYICLEYGVLSQIQLNYNYN